MKNKTQECVKVAVRCRPLNDKEKQEKKKEIVQVTATRNEIRIKNPLKPNVH
jgi:kinesin family protein 3/17